MTTGNTSLLGLALPVTGELNGTWGDTVNNSITSLLDTAIAGTTTLSTDADVTLTTTVLAANQARQAILVCSGARTALRTITAPAQSKTYTVINSTTGGYSVKIVGVGPTTGVLVGPGETAYIAWNGSDFVTIGGNSAVAVSVSGTAIDLSQGTYFYKTIAANTAFTVTNVPASGAVASFYLELTNGGAYVTSFWSGVKWANDTPISLTSLGTDLLQFISRDGGTTWEGVKVGTYGAYTLNQSLNIGGNIYGGGGATNFILDDQCAYSGDYGVARYAGTFGPNVAQPTSWTYAPALRNIAQGTSPSLASITAGIYGSGLTMIVDSTRRVYLGSATNWYVSSGLSATSWATPGATVTALSGVYSTTNSQWVLGGGLGNIAYSTDGYAWTATNNLLSTSFGAQGVQLMVSNSTTVIAIGAYAGVGTSTDSGATWTYQAGLLTAWTSGQPVAATYNTLSAIIGVAGAGGKFATSADNGVTWTDRSAALQGTGWGTSNPPGRFALTTAYVGSATYFVLVSSNGTIAYSADGGATWTSNTTLQTALGGSTPIAFTGVNGVFIPSGSSYSALSSTYLVAYGNAGMSAYSADGGSTWTVIGGPSQSTTQFLNFKPASLSNSTSTNLYSIAWNGTLFMAVGSMAAATSYDGVNWTIRSNGIRTFFPGISNSGFSTMYSAAYGGGTWVIGGTTSKIFTSTDNGVTWTYQNGFYTLNANTNLSVAAYGNSRFITGGASGRLAYSTNSGVTWTLATTGFGTSSILGATYANSLFVIGGVLGKLATSPDAITWTSYTTAINGTTFGTDTIYGIAWSGSKFVVIGATGKVLTSPDGVTWTYQGGLLAVLTDLPANVSMLGVTWTGTEFVAVGGVSYAIVATSPDGVTWTNRTAQIPQVTGPYFGAASNPAYTPLNSLRCVASNGTTLVAGGSGGWLMNR